MQDVAGDLLAVEGQRPQRVGDRSTPSPSSGSRAERPPSSSGAMKRRSSSISPRVEERARQVRAALEQDRGDRRVQRAELVQRRAHARGLVLAGGDDDLGARVLQRVGVRARRGARDDDDERHLVRRPRRAWSPAAGGAVASKTTRRGWRRTPSIARGQLRVVGQRGADARRRRRRTRRASGARARAAVLGGDPLRVAGLASRPCRRGVMADLKSTHGRPVRACLRKAWLLQARAARRARRRRGRPRTPSSRRMPRPRPEAFSVGSSLATTTRAMPAAQDRVGARRLLALVAAGLERDVERRAAQVGVAGGGDRVDLGVRAAVLLVPALAHDLAVLDEHRADDRVGAARCPRRARRARWPARGARDRFRCAALDGSSLAQRAFAAR